MLYIRQVKHLARHLGVTLRYLEYVIQTIPSCCEELELIDPARPGKVRVVLNVFGEFRKLQNKMLRCVLLPKLEPSVHSHGGVIGRDIKSNTQAHAESTFAFATDISDFYPSVSHNRVYRLFVGRFHCTPDVARICTRLCTHKYHLALGLPTSPILADQILHVVDQRIGHACEELGLVYTRFVDDLTVSGFFELDSHKCGIPALIERILSENGLCLNREKHRFGRLCDEFAITKIRIHNGKLDVRHQYAAELDRQIEDARILACGGVFRGPYFTQAQIAGRVRFVCWINPGRKQQLIPKLNCIDWTRFETEARNRGLIATRKTLRPMNKVAL